MLLTKRTHGYLAVAASTPNDIYHPSSSISVMTAPRTNHHSLFAVVAASTASHIHSEEIAFVLPCKRRAITAVSAKGTFPEYTVGVDRAEPVKQTTDSFFFFLHHLLFVHSSIPLTLHCSPVFSICRIREGAGPRRSAAAKVAGRPQNEGDGESGGMEQGEGNTGARALAKTQQIVEERVEVVCRTTQVHGHQSFREQGDKTTKEGEGDVEDREQGKGDAGAHVLDKSRGLPRRAWGTARL